MHAFWHFVAFYDILWHFGIFTKKSNKKSNPIFRFYPIFPILRLFPTFRLNNSSDDGSVDDADDGGVDDGDDDCVDDGENNGVNDGDHQ